MISILSVHLITLGFVLSMIVFSDIEAHRWFKGKEINVKNIRLLHKFIWLSIVLMIVTGFTMFWPLRDYLLQNTAFQIKMGFVLVLLINSFAINKLINIVEKPYADLTKAEKRPLMISGAISTASWVAVIVSALSMGI